MRKEALRDGIVVQMPEQNVIILRCYLSTPNFRDGKVKLVHDHRDEVGPDSCTLKTYKGCPLIMNDVV